jgi:hypothetical protein
MVWPIVNNQADIVEGVNYALSGPGGLGQSFAGFSSYDSQWLTGNFRAPFTQDTVTAANLYVAPIALNNAQQLDARTIKYTFTTAQPAPPFSIGNGLTITGITPAAYNSQELRDAGNSINQIGVIECTTTYVTVRTVADIVVPLGTYTSGGSITYSCVDAYLSTDGDVTVSVQGAQERVFVSAQLDQLISYNVTSGPAAMNVYAEISRYTAFQNNDPTNPDFIFDDPYIVVSKAYAYTGLSGTGTIPLIETVFTNAIDSPPPGLYRYILEVYFETVSGTIEVTQDQLLLRSTSAQVIKP